MFKGFTLAQLQEMSTLNYVKVAKIDYFIKLSPVFDTIEKKHSTGVVV